MGEIDFLIQQDKKVIPIEVKSGNDYKKHAALNRIMEADGWNIDEGIVLCKGNLEQAGGITYLPWYMTMFLKQESYRKPMIVKVDLSGLDGK